MTTTYNNTYWPSHPLSHRRPYGWSKVGVKHGDRVTPYVYHAYGAYSTPYAEREPNGAYAGLDMPNSFPCTDLRSTQLINLCQGQSLSNAAYSKLVDKVRNGPASLGEDLAQWRQAAQMITGRAQDLRHLLWGITNNHPGAIRYALRDVGAVGLKGAKYKDLLSRLRKTSPTLRMANLLLEFNFGWQPIIQDIYDYCGVWNKDLPAGSFQAQARGQYLRTVNRSVYKSTFNGTLLCRMGCRASVSNPNAFLLQQMGIANPVEVAWNVLPWSFLADWLFDVSSYLGSLTDWLGCNISRTYTTFYGFGKGEDRTSFPPHVFHCSAWGVERQGNLVFPKPNLHIFANVGHSWKRAANAVSLARQLIR